MKKIVIFILFLPILLIGKPSIFPLDFTFEDNLLAKSVWVGKSAHKYPDTNTTIRHVSILLVDEDDNMYDFGNFPFFNWCPSIKTIDDLHNYKKLLNKDLQNCYSWVDKFLNSNNIKTLKVGDFNILINEDELHATALIFYKDRFSKAIEYSSLYSLGKEKYIDDKKNLYSLLNSIKVNTDIHDVEYYLKKAQEFKYIFYNTSLKNIISAYMLDIDNPEIDKILFEVYESEKGWLTAWQKNLTR